MAKSTNSWVLVGLIFVLFILLFAIPPFAQPLWYHDFADQRPIFNVPHFYNVASNLPFVAVGVWGLWYLIRRAPDDKFLNSWDRWLYGVFFAAVMLTGFGSAYYHANPGNERLLGDRLPLAVAFMALFALILAERVSYRAGVTLFVPFVLLGAGSVIYWHLTEEWQRGDLRPYLLVQLYPLLVIPLILSLFPPRFTLPQDYWAALLCYLFAKGLELADRLIYSQGQIISGHTLKHLFAALGPYFILHMIQKRRRIAPASS